METLVKLKENLNLCSSCEKILFRETRTKYGRTYKGIITKVSYIIAEQ